MREIKCKAWDKTRKEWCRVNVGWCNGNLAFARPEIEYWQDEIEVVFYTGLKDNDDKGQEIYHQDILKVGDGWVGDNFKKGGNFVVEWVDDGWAIVDKDGEFLCELSEAAFNRGVKVIGNIYENKELLDG